MPNSIRVQRIILNFSVLAGLFGVWELSVAWWDISALVLPPPSAVAREVAKHWTLLLAATAQTAWKALLGLLFAGATAALSVIILRHGDLVRRFLLRATAAVESVPKIVFAPAFTIWLGIGVAPKVSLAAMLCFYPCLQRLETSYRNCPTDLISFAQSLGASESAVLWRIRIRWMLPDALEAIKISIPLAFVGVIVGEFIASANGIGPLILRALGDLNMPLVLGASVSVSLVAAGFVSVVSLHGIRIQSGRRHVTH